MLKHLDEPLPLDTDRIDRTDTDNIIEVMRLIDLTQVNKHILDPQ